MRRTKGYDDSILDTSDHGLREEARRHKAEAALRSECLDIPGVFGPANPITWAWRTAIQDFRTLAACFKPDAKASGRDAAVVFGALIRLALCLAILAVHTVIVLFVLKHVARWGLGGFESSQLKNL